MIRDRVIEEIKVAKMKRWPERYGEEWSDGQLDRDKKMWWSLYLSALLFLHLSLYPFLLRSTHTGLFVYSLSETPASESLSPRWYTFRCIAENKPARWDIIYIHTSPASPLPWCDCPPGSWPWVGLQRVQQRFVTPVMAWSWMFQLNGYRIDVDTKVAGSESWHDHRDLVGGCQSTGVSKCDAATYFRTTLTQWTSWKKEERMTTLCLSVESFSLSFSPILTSLLSLPVFHTQSSVLLHAFFSPTHPWSSHFFPFCPPCTHLYPPVSVECSDCSNPISSHSSNYQQ